jgi:hypothetical protein
MNGPNRLCNILVAIFAVVVCPDRGLGQPTDPAAGSTTSPAAYDTPAKAFDAYQAAVERGDGEAAAALLTSECQNALLFNEWADQVTGNSEVSQLLELVDENKRRELTRAYLPTRRSDLAPIFAKSLKDRRAALTSIVKSMEILRGNALSNLTVKDVTVEGDKATSKLVFKDEEDGPDDEPLHFKKANRGWLIDLRSEEDREQPIPLEPAAVTAPPTSAVSYVSPAAAFSAWMSALEQRDVGAAWHAVTPRYRNDVLFVGRRQLIGSHGDNLMLQWYGDLHRFTLGERGNPLPTEQSERAQAYVESLYDPVEFLAAIWKRQAELNHLRHRKVVCELNDVTTNADRGRGTVNTFFKVEDAGGGQKPIKHQAYQLPCYFLKTAAGWQLDLPTAEEVEESRRASTPAAAQQASDKRKPNMAFASPEEAFAALQRSLRTYDVDLFRQCIPEAYCQDVIFWAWATQFHFQTEPPTLHEFIDEQRRRELTRERVPIESEELQPLLLECIRDQRGALAASLHILKFSGKLQDVKISGNEARGTLVDDSKPDPKPMDALDVPGDRKIGFVKDAQGWRIDPDANLAEDEVEVPEHEVDEVTKKIRALKPAPTKSWTRKPAPRYETPQLVNEAQRAGFRENDPEKVWHCLTERKRESFMHDQLLMLVESGGGDLMMAWYGDNAKMHDKRSPRERMEVAARAKLPDIDHEDESRTTPAHEALERHNYRAECALEKDSFDILYDPQAYFAAVVKRMELTNRGRMLRYPDMKPSPLENVVVEGDRAYGVTKHVLIAKADDITGGQKPVTVWSSESEYEVIGYFARVNGSWLLDIPNEEETIAQWRKRENENRESREKAEVERGKPAKVPE